MTNKGKAKQIVEKFKEPTMKFSFDKGWYYDKNDAKKAAEIAVDLVIESLHYSDTSFDLINDIDNWNKIKKEIKKI